MMPSTKAGHLMKKPSYFVRRVLPGLPGRELRSQILMVIPERSIFE